MTHIVDLLRWDNVKNPHPFLLLAIKLATALLSIKRKEYILVTLIVHGTESKYVRQVTIVFLSNSINAKQKTIKTHSVVTMRLNINKAALPQCSMSNWIHPEINAIHGWTLWILRLLLEMQHLEHRYFIICTSILKGTKLLVIYSVNEKDFIQPL
jgi:hypothetical protein